MSQEEQQPPSSLPAAIIENHSLEYLDIESLVFDPDNPNTLTNEQMSSLARSFKRFGYLAPIIVDQDNRIADGEHRALVYKQMGLQTIPAYKLSLKDDVERRILRQVMNKLHGEHELTKDTQEIIKILESGKLTDLSELLAQEQKSFQYMIDQFNESQNKVLDALSEQDIETNHKCPQCGYEW